MNILLLITDQQRADTIEKSTVCRTPNLDLLAKSGVRFTRAYTPNPICSPARASLMTGLYPCRHGMVDVTHNVPSYRAGLQPGLPMWSQVLKQAGYHTGYFGKWHVERSDNSVQPPGSVNG
ncbi:sulfatase-like hydrolase/transferase [Paenibacillus sp. CC-CFT747]|nr:sulfatase-like hydrolase/transferase [Paenibacillus sp. CC-CFT747]